MSLHPKIASIVVILSLANCLSLFAQQPSTPRRTDQEVVRVFTELVQTDVTVLDKQGRFVDGLKASDFELRIDGQPKTIEFFEKVTAGSVSEEVQLAAARGRSRGNATSAPVPLDRGRPVFFYLDDFHLDQSSLKITRQVVEQFIEKEMGQNDEAAIASASGQIGFLQQLTDNRSVLRAALARVNHRPYVVQDFERPIMTEYQALLIESFDRDVRDYFIEETIRQNPGMNRQQAESIVTGRATSILQQASRTTALSLIGLESLVKSVRGIPGRKLVFFISDGFFLDERNSDANVTLRRITSAAAKNGVVIYSIDARGLFSGLPDASQPGQFDPSGRLQRATSGEITASQDALNSLARDTGGRAYFNSNRHESSLDRSLEETSTYYLLAWKPEAEAKANKFRRIEVKLTSRPDLTVHVKRGYFDVEPTTAAEKKKPTKDVKDVEKAAGEELRKLIGSAFPDRTLPISLNLIYADSQEKGAQLSALMSIEDDFLTYAPDETGKPSAEVEVTGRFYNDKGQQGAEFGNKISIRGPSIEAIRGRDFGYSHTVFLAPGLYQVRVAARDVKSGKSGSAHAWIEIPNASSGQFALSSPIIGKRAEEETRDVQITTQKVGSTAQLAPGRSFSPSEFLRFLVFAYNAQVAPADGKPDLAIQVHLVRDNQPVITAPLRKITVDGVRDLKRIAYAAEMPLAGLSAGRYMLRLTVVDRVAKTSATQQAKFTIE